MTDLTDGLERMVFPPRKWAALYPTFFAQLVVERDPGCTVIAIPYELDEEAVLRVGERIHAVLNQRRFDLEPEAAPAAQESSRSLHW